MHPEKKSPGVNQSPQPAKNYTPLAPEGYTYLTVKEMASRLRISNDSVIRRCRDGGFPGAIQIGKLWRIPAKEEIPHGGSL